MELRQDYPKGIAEARGRDCCFVGTVSAGATGMGGLGDAPNLAGCPIEDGRTMKGGTVD